MARNSKEKKRAGIAKVMLAKPRPDPDNPGQPIEHAGMGIVVDRRNVVTCAHVVNSALGRPLESQEQPKERISVTFPFARGCPPVTGEIVNWKPVNAMPVGDVAGIALDDDVPDEVGVAALADGGESQDGDRLSAYGHAAGAEKPAWAPLQFREMVTESESQIDSGDFVSAFIEPGYSGAAVWNEKLLGVVGMVIGRVKRSDRRVAYMITASNLLGPDRSAGQPLERTQSGNHLLIPTVTPFNKLCHDMLMRYQRQLGIAEDFYSDPQRESQGYRAGWKRFLDHANAKWLFANHPETARADMSAQTMSECIAHMRTSGKKVVFFESGQEFLGAGDSPAAGAKLLANPVTVIQTDSKHAIKAMIQRASRTTHLGRDRELPLFIVLIPGPQHPTACERFNYYLEWASSIAKHSVSKKLEGIFIARSAPRSVSSFLPTAVALFPAGLEDWTRGRAKDAVSERLPYLKQHCPRADYLFLCGNDDIALGAYDAVCDRRNQGCQTCGNARTVFVGFDGLPEMRDLVDKGNAITACANLEHMALFATELVRTNGRSRPPDGRILVRATVLPP